MDFAKMDFAKMMMIIIDLEELSENCSVQGYSNISDKLEVEIGRLCMIQTEWLETINKLQCQLKSRKEQLG